MSSDWIHCNLCLTLPAANVQFSFTSCGHIVCKKCLAKVPNSPTCPYCKKSAKFMEINRTLKPEMQMFFRNPRDLATEYTKNLSSVLDFQAGHRSRYARAQQDKNTKLTKFATAAQGEIKKRAEAEKRALAESLDFRNENEKLKSKMQQLENIVAARDREIERLRNAPTFGASPSGGVGGRVERTDSGLGDTPMCSLSFIENLTSTPINRSESPVHGYSGRKKSRDRLRQMFQSSTGSIPSPIVGNEQTTPAMLGLAKKGQRSSSESNRRKSAPAAGNEFMFDEEMGGF